MKVFQKYTNQGGRGFANMPGGGKYAMEMGGVYCCKGSEYLMSVDTRPSLKFSEFT